MSKRAGSVEVRTDLLYAVAKWAHADADRPIGAVAFRSGQMIATDGCRLVVVPVETHGLEFGVSRSSILAAVAAQNSLARDGMEPNVGHDLVDLTDSPDGGLTVEGLTVADGPCSNRKIRLAPKFPDVELDIGAVLVTAPKVDISQYPDVRPLIDGSPDGSSPDGYLLDARFLAAIEEVNTAHADYQSGVHVVHWSRKVAGKRGPMVLASKTGVTFVVMPQKDKGP